MPKSAFNKTHRTAKKNKAGGDESDQFQTPWYALPMVEQYLNPEWIIWEPACGKGYIVDYFNRGSTSGWRCWGTDYLAGEAYDFFTTRVHTTRRCDCIVTNPPWSLKIEWTLRCLELGKPFALLVPLTYLEEAGSRLVDENNMEIIKPYGRIAYETPHEGWWSHYDKLADGERCRYKDPCEFTVCPKCGGTEEIRQIKSAPQMQSIWLTWDLHIGSPLTYYSDMKIDKERLENNGKSPKDTAPSGHD